MPKAGFEPTIPAINRPRPTPQTARPLCPGTKYLAQNNPKPWDYSDASDEMIETEKLRNEERDLAWVCLFFK
jgi:hypothetical protein